MKMQEMYNNPAKYEFLIGIIAVNCVFASLFVKSSYFFTSKKGEAHMDKP